MHTVTRSFREFDVSADIAFSLRFIKDDLVTRQAVKSFGLPSYGQIAHSSYDAYLVAIFEDAFAHK